MYPRPSLSRALWLLAVLALWLLPLGAIHAQQETAKVRAVAVTLVADTKAVEAGKPFTAGVRFDISEGWDIYWQFVGDIGQATSIEWELPPGFTAGPLQWPLPVSHVASGDFLNYVYLNEALLFSEIQTPAKLPSGPIAIKAKIRWQMCDVTRCEQGNADLALTLSDGPAQPANAELFAHWRAQLPKAVPPPFSVTWDRNSDKQLVLQIEGVAKDTPIEFFPLPPQGVTPGHPTTSDIAGNGARTITFPLEGGKANLPWRGIIATGKEGAQREGWLIEAEPSATSSSVAAAKPAATPTTNSTNSAPPSSSSGKTGLLGTLFIAFLGGLIMNVMPCVLPVITLKIFGFVNQAGEAPGRVFKLGLAFNAGVFSFFLLLAAIMAKLRGAFNWGYQLQNPYLLAIMIGLVFILGLSLLGVFEIALTGGAAATLGDLSSKKGYGGAYLHGLFTTLLGTSCTAPFLGTSLSYAVTQPVSVIFLLFVAIATGMCLPYFLLTAQPAWMRFLPKPGLWMERVKQVMGFAMLAIAAWLFGVLAGRGAGAVAAMSWFILVLGFSAWLYGLHGSVFTRVAALVLPFVGYFVFIHGKLNTTAPTVTTGIEQKIEAARAAGSPVFIDFTAEWCLNCKFFERTVLDSADIQAKFAEKKVVFIKADWTNTDDPEVSKLLKGYGGVGVPLYVLYRPGETQPMIRESLTKSLLLEELDKIKNAPLSSARTAAQP
jgi:thiol:disulfide interchange protein DsbD